MKKINIVVTDTMLHVLFTRYLNLLVFTIKNNLCKYLSLQQVEELALDTKFLKDSEESTKIKEIFDEAVDKHLAMFIKQSIESAEVFSGTIPLTLNLVGKFIAVTEDKVLAYIFSEETSPIAKQINEFLKAGTK